MRRGVAFIAVALVALTATPASAQSAAPAGPAERKVTSRALPSYPDLAKKMHIRGAVKVEVVVRANGTVKSTRVLGGNPVLVDAAIDAVGKWKFEVAQNETTEVVQLTFEDE